MCLLLLQTTVQYTELFIQVAHVEGERVRGARGAKKTVSKLEQEGIEAELEDIRQTLNLVKKQSIFQELKLLLKWRNLKRYSWPLNIMHCMIECSPSFTVYLV